MFNLKKVIRNKVGSHATFLLEKTSWFKLISYLHVPYTLMKESVYFRVTEISYLLIYTFTID